MIAAKITAMMAAMIAAMIAGMIAAMMAAMIAAMIVASCDQPGIAAHPVLRPDLGIHRGHESWRPVM
jgi:hypothetical protein